MVLTCISLLANAAENLFMYSLTICMSSLETGLLKSFAHFLNKIVCLFIIELQNLVCSGYKSFIGYLIFK